MRCSIDCCPSIALARGSHSHENCSLTALRGMSMSSHGCCAGTPKTPSFGCSQGLPMGEMLEVT